VHSAQIVADVSKTDTKGAKTVSFGMERVYIYNVTFS